jgi:hemerythrin-like domain-containing protein
MNYASQDLVNEHEAILFALKVLEEIADRVNEGKDVPPGDIIELIEFLKLFADKCHHGKEEGFYFPALESAGIPRANGPIGVMLSEHDAGRAFIKEMQNSVSEKISDIEGFVKAAQGYVGLLRSHIEKENTVLFPMGDAKLSESEHKELLNKFEEFEENVIGTGKHEELHKQLDEFNRKYLK